MHIRWLPFLPPEEVAETTAHCSPSFSLSLSVLEVYTIYTLLQKCAQVQQHMS